MCMYARTGYKSDVCAHVCAHLILTLRHLLLQIEEEIMDVCLCPLLHTHVTSLCTYVTSSYTYVTSSYAYGGNHECMPLSTPAHTCHIIIHLCHIIIHMSHHHTHMEEIMDVCLCPLLHTHTHTIRHIGVCIYVSKSVQHIITTRRSTNKKKNAPAHTYA